MNSSKICQFSNFCTKIIQIMEFKLSYLNSPNEYEFILNLNFFFLKIHIKTVRYPSKIAHSGIFQSSSLRSCAQTTLTISIYTTPTAISTTTRISVPRPSINFSILKKSSTMKPTTISTATKTSRAINKNL